MPIYEYMCEQCGDTVEALQKMSDSPLEDCPSGDGGKMTRLMSAHNVGSGSSPTFGGGGCATPAVCGPQAAAQCGGGSFD